jgi:hypothetical protein
MFNPEEQVDFVKLVETLDWTKEIDPVYLVKTVNKVAGLKGTKQYKTNEVSFGLLLKSFEKRVIDFVNVRFCGKDRFYTLKDKVSREEVIHFVKTGKKLEIDTTAIPKKKEDFSKYYAPIPEEKTAAVVKKKRTFPDDEALLKTVYLLWTLKKHSGSVEAKVIMEIKHTEGWKNQRACAGKQYTVYQEANAVCTQFLDMKDPIEVVNKKTVKFNGSLEELDSKINDVISLIEDKGIKEKATSIVEPKPVPKPEIVKPVMDKEPTKEAPTKPTGRVIISSPVVGKNQYEKISEPTVVFENTRTRWNKALVSEELKKLKRGTQISFLDLQAKIKRHRFVEIGTAEVRNILTEVLEKQYRGMGKMDKEKESIMVGSEAMVEEFARKYDASKITETIFLRIHMSLEEMLKRFPELKPKLASEISENDNIYSIEASRSVEAEKALTKLFWCLRDGEKILESPNNWTVKRIETLQEKIGL